MKKEIFVCHLTNAVRAACRFQSAKVHINTVIIKHLYDRKPAEEFDFVIRNVHTIIKYPDNIYLNKDSKRGSYCFVKKLLEAQYFCSIEAARTEAVDDVNYVVTCFRLRDEKYIQKYELISSWKGGTPSS